MAHRQGWDSQRWEHILTIADRVLDLPDDSRQSFIEITCGQNEELRSDVAKFLASCEEAEKRGGILSTSATDFAAPMVADTLSKEASYEIERREILCRRLGEELGDKYDLIREIGRGGAATVFLALDKRHERHVAIKVLDQTNGSTMNVERFLAEVRVTAGLMHPHILPLHESGEVNGLPYYVMPYVEGETLRKRLITGGVLQMDDVLTLLRELASALDYAHRRSVIHRDIKPENILLADGHAVVADFGIACALYQARKDLLPDHFNTSADPVVDPKRRDTHPVLSGDDSAWGECWPSPLTQPGLTPGTPAYMAPEQLLHANGMNSSDLTDQRVDLYALGLTAYEVLCGEHPFGSSAPGLRDGLPPVTAAMIAKRRPDAPLHLCSIVARLLSDNPDGRPDSAAAVLSLLEHSAPLTEQTLSGRQVIWTALGAVGIAAAFLVVVSLVSFLRPDKPLSSAIAGHDTGSLTQQSTSPPSATGSNTAAQARISGTSDGEAYELYSRGRFNLVMRNRQRLELAIGSFQAAIARDPGFARAYAGLSMAYTFLPLYHTESSDSTAALLSMSNAQRAMSLDSTLAEAHLALAMALDLQGRFRDAIAHYRASLALDPASVLSHHILGFAQLNVGDMDSALVHLRMAAQIDPLAHAVASAVAAALLDMRKFDEAIQAARHAAAIDSTFVFSYQLLALAQVYTGRPAEAIQTLKHGLAIDPKSPQLMSTMVLAYAAANDWEDAASIRQQLQYHASESPIEAAYADLVFGNREPLIALLTSRPGQRRITADGGHLGCNPLYDPLWEDPRFAAAMKRLSIAPCGLARVWPVGRRPDRYSAHATSGYQGLAPLPFAGTTSDNNTLPSNTPATTPSDTPTPNG